MEERSALVGREAERAQLSQAVEQARRGAGSLFLLCGEAGVGKTRLTEEVAADAGVPVLRGVAMSGASHPYGPVVALLRSYLRARPGGLDGDSPLRPHLAMLLPELGPQASSSDRATLTEAIRCALERVGGSGDPLLVLDDLQWSDEATIELLAAVGSAVAEMPIVLVAAYRSDGLPRDHLLRWLRNELRRGGNLAEMALGPLDGDATARLLAELIGGKPSPSLVAAVHDRTEGVPFFVEELARALRASDRLQPGPRGLELGGDGDVPVPDTVRDAVLMSVARLSDEGRAAAEAGAWACAPPPACLTRGARRQRLRRSAARLSISAWSPSSPRRPARPS